MKWIVSASGGNVGATGGRIVSVTATATSDACTSELPTVHPAWTRGRTPLATRRSSTGYLRVSSYATILQEDYPALTPA